MTYFSNVQRAASRLVNGWDNPHRALFDDVRPSKDAVFAFVRDVQRFVDDTPELAQMRMPGGTFANDAITTRLGELRSLFGVAGAAGSRDGVLSLRATIREAYEVAGDLNEARRSPVAASTIASRLDEWDQAVGSSS